MRFSLRGRWVVAFVDLLFAAVLVVGCLCWVIWLFGDFCAWVLVLFGLYWYFACLLDFIVMLFGCEFGFVLGLLFGVLRLVVYAREYVFTVIICFGWWFVLLCYLIVLGFLVALVFVFAYGLWF